jgi:hypothetical protein
VIGSTADCPRCGDPIDEDDSFCSACGLDLATYHNLWPEPAAQVATPLVAASPMSSSDPAPLPSHVSPPGAQPWGAPDDQTAAPDVPSYLGWAAILVTLCWPAFWAGIPALAYAGRVETRLASGDLTGAQEASAKARTWCWVTFWAGLVLWAVALTLVAAL